MIPDYGIEFDDSKNSNANKNTDVNNLVDRKRSRQQYDNNYSYDQQQQQQLQQPPYSHQQYPTNKRHNNYGFPPHYQHGRRQYNDFKPLDRRVITHEHYDQQYDNNHLYEHVNYDSAVPYNSNNDRHNNNDNKYDNQQPVNDQYNNTNQPPPPATQFYVSPSPDQQYNNNNNKHYDNRNYDNISPSASPPQLSSISNYNIPSVDPVHLEPASCGCLRCFKCHGIFDTRDKLITHIRNKSRCMYKPLCATYCPHIDNDVTGRNVHTELTRWTEWFKLPDTQDNYLKSIDQQQQQLYNDKFNLLTEQLEVARKQYAAHQREIKHAQRMAMLEQQQAEYATKQREERDANRAECKFWLNGACNKGDRCRFKHIGVPQVKNELCRYVLNGKCSKGDKCYYSHDISKVPCRFYHLYGRCKNGDECVFVHGDVSQQVKERLAELNEIAARRKRGEIITADEQRRLDDEAKAMAEQEETRKKQIVEAPVDPFAAETVFD